MVNKRGRLADDGSRVSARTLLGKAASTGRLPSCRDARIRQAKTQRKGARPQGRRRWADQGRRSHRALIPGPDGGTTVDVGVPIREEALFALRDVAPDRAGHVFVTALGDSSDRVRTAAVVALYERGDSERLAEAVARLPAEGQGARYRCAGPVQPAPRRQQRQAGGCTRSQARPRFAQRGGGVALVPALLRAEERPEAAGEVVQLLISALSHEQEIVADRAEALLVRLGPASIEALTRELAGGATPHRAAALIGEIQDGRGLQPLVAALSHPDARVRSQCCSALGKLRDPAAVEPLVQATQDPEHEVRVLAGAALDSMGTAAIALSVAALLRPMLGEAVAKESQLGMLPNGGPGHSIELARGSRAPEEPELTPRWRLGYQAVQLRLITRAARPESRNRTSARLMRSPPIDMSSVERVEAVWESDVADAAWKRQVARPRREDQGRGDPRDPRHRRAQSRRGSARRRRWPARLVG